MKPTKKIRPMSAFRRKLVEAHLDLVDRIAGHEARHLPAWIGMDEVVAAGRFGLCQAASRFDKTKHASFAVYACWRIRGAIIDAHQGPRYPRRYVQMPEHWDGTHQTENVSRGGSCCDSVKNQMPELLIDRRSVLDQLIEAEQCVIVSISAGYAEQQLDQAEADALARHVCGESLAKIASAQGCSKTAAHKILTAAKEKMRAALLARLDREAA